MEEHDSLDVISTVGMLGIGKTTMARRIFRDPSISYEFPILIWVDCSSIETDMRSVYLTILKSFSSRDMSSKSVDELRVLVPQYLKMVKFFMVVDDVWSRSDWKEIKEVLPMKNRKSKVLITSRLGGIGRHESSWFLSPQESWHLLQLRVFEGLYRCPKNLEKVGEMIAGRCYGIPLAIVLVGGILLKNMSRKPPSVVEKEWEGVHRSLQERCQFDDWPVANEVYQRVMQMSILTMPDDLKDCFLYLGMLTDDTEIPVWKLTQLWIAEGFVIHKEGQILEDTAKEYLMELLGRNLLMADNINIYGEVKTFRVHGVIHECCQHEATIRNINIQYRQLCINHHVHEFPVKTPKSPMTRSFLCLPSSPIVLVNEDVPALFKALDLIRVFEANSIKFPQFPTQITQMFHLRYITLSCDELKVLPEAISNLWNLQTLVVDTLSRTLEVKADIWKLMRLRYFKTKASLSLMESEGTGCENLYTLTRLSPQSFSRDVPNKAKHLKELGVRGMHSDSMSFEKLDSLEKLKLYHDVFPRKQSDYPLAQPAMFPPKLKFLVLSGTYLDWKHISMVGNLPALEALKLKDNAFKGANWEVADSGFRHLQALSITETELKYWTAPSGSFPKLKNLELKNCEKLLEVPLALAGTLERLYMSCVTRYAVSCAEKIKERTATDAKFELEIHHGDM